MQTIPGAKMEIAVNQGFHIKIQQHGVHIISGRANKIGSRPIGPHRPFELRSPQNQLVQRNERVRNQKSGKNIVADIFRRISRYQQKCKKTAQHRRHQQNDVVKIKHNLVHGFSPRHSYFFSLQPHARRLARAFSPTGDTIEDGPIEPEKIVFEGFPLTRTRSYHTHRPATFALERQPARPHLE